MRAPILQNRKQAGILLSEKLRYLKGERGIVLAVPRGGVPVGYEIARTLGWPLDLALSKKIGHPLSEEYAIGSVSPDAVLLEEHPEVSKDYLDREILRIKTALEEKYRLYKGERTPEDVKGRIVIITDDGIATGNTLLTTIMMLRKKGAGKIIAAVPVVPRSNIGKIEDAADEFIYLAAPVYFPGVGAFYEEFGQVEDKEVIKLLNDTNAVKQKPGNTET